MDLGPQNPAPQTLGSQNLDPLKAHIRQVCGLIFDADKVSVLKGAVATRMKERLIGNADAYLKCVESEEQEFQALVNLLTINETYFFRETQHLDLLTNRLLPKLVGEKAVGRKVRILCAGCSTGEEPYSLSIAILEKFGKTAALRFDVTGTDIDSLVLSRAANAIYSGLSFRNMPPDMAQKWFTPCGASRYQLNQDVRQMVTFKRLNLLDEVYPDDLSHQDVILFRNVSIYFDTEVRKAVQAKLAKLLNPGGALIVGLSETLANDFGQLPLVSDSGVFYFVKSEPGAKAKHPPKLIQPKPAISLPKSETPPPVKRHRPESPLTPPLKPAPSKPSKSTATIEQALAYVTEKRYDDALSIIDHLDGQDLSDVRLAVMRALIAFNRKDMAQAKILAQQALKISEWNLDALFLLAQLARRDEDSAEAERCLKQIIYNEPRCWPAHYWLAELYRAKGDRDKAGREYRVVVNQTSGACDAKGGLLLFPLGVSPAEVGALCSRHLQSLGVNR